MHPVSTIRLSAAIVAARMMSTGLRISGRGGGTAAPGLAALTIDPTMVRKVTARLPDGVLVVAGTNGKTTTSRLLADILGRNGLTVAHNRSGSNLMRGVASAFAQRSSLRGQLNADVAVIEADEAAFSEIVGMTSPRLVVLNNLFRDQLDRYGELDAIAKRWQPVLAALDASSTVVVNADDPTLVSITDQIAAKRLYFGLDPGAHCLERLPHAADAATCRRCGWELQYRVLALSHLGDWACGQCGWRRPPLDVEGSEIALNGVESLDMDVRTGQSGPSRLHLSIPGLYNAYNVAGAVAAAHALGIAPSVVSSACSSFKAPFGRMEHIRIEGRDITLALVKNPVAFNEMLRMLASGPDGLLLPTLIAINDLDADGRDVSWLWDVDFELLERGSAPLATTGIRGADMANRLKYAGVGSERLTPLPDDLEAGIFGFVRRLPAGEPAFVLATYTAMLELRRVLARAGLTKSFWEQ
jgi:UDP-N-acetylmuramyl tripeptide synthase